MRIRISYVKGTDIRFTSALDMHAIWERSFRRAGIKILYTQGFRPKPRIQLGLPLPLGFISKNEIVDLWVEDSKILLNDFSEILSSCLPMGIEINSIKEIALSEKPLVSQIQSSTYQTHFYDKSISRQILNKEVEKILNATEIFRIKRNGKRYNLRPLIINIEILDTPSKQPYLSMELVSQANATGRADEVVLAMGFAISDVLIERVSYTYV